VCGPLAALAGIKGGKAAAALFHGAERDDEATRERRTFYVNRVPMKWMFVGGSREIEVYATRRACDTATICTVCLRKFLRSSPFAHLAAIRVAIFHPLLTTCCYLRCGGYVFAFTCLSVSRITQKVVDEFR